MTVQQGSFLPMMCMIEKGEIDPNNYVVDANTGAKIIHYTGHFGNKKALRALIEVFKVDLAQTDFYKLNIAHYAARQGELSILFYISKFN